jgi:hypothetical protein
VWLVPCCARAAGHVRATTRLEAPCLSPRPPPHPTHHHLHNNTTTSNNRLQERSGGKVPVINERDFWLADSDAIVAHLEAQVPQPSMASDVPPEVTGGLFGAFRGLLMAKVCVCV